MRSPLHALILGLLGAGIGYSLWKTRPAAEQVK